MNGEIKHAVIIDEYMQVQAYLISYKNNNLNEWDEFLDLDARISKTDFVNNIYSRDANFTDKMFRSDRYYGWNISKTDYERIRRMISLLPYKLEFENLAKYP